MDRRDDDLWRGDDERRFGRDRDRVAGDWRGLGLGLGRETEWRSERAENDRERSRDAFDDRRFRDDWRARDRWREPPAESGFATRRAHRDRDDGDRSPPYRSDPHRSDRELNRDWDREQWDRDWAREQWDRIRGSGFGPDVEFGRDEAAGRDRRGPERPWLDRARDEVGSWMGDPGAERRRAQDEARRYDERGRYPETDDRSDTGWNDPIDTDREDRRRRW